MSFSCQINVLQNYNPRSVLTFFRKSAISCSLRSIKFSTQLQLAASRQFPRSSSDYPPAFMETTFVQNVYMTLLSFFDSAPPEESGQRTITTLSSKLYNPLNAKESTVLYQAYPRDTLQIVFDNFSQTVGESTPIKSETPLSDSPLRSSIPKSTLKASWQAIFSSKVFLFCNSFYSLLRISTKFCQFSAI